MEIILDIIVGDKLKNDFMKAADLFEKGKHLGEISQVKMTGENVKLDLLVSVTRKAYEKSGKNVIFISIRTVDGKLNITYTPYIEKGVQSISNGHQWGLFKDILEHLGYNVETTEWMAVTSASFKASEQKLKEFYNKTTK